MVQTILRTARNVQLIGDGVVVSITAPLAFIDIENDVDIAEGAVWQGGFRFEDFLPGSSLSSYRFVLTGQVDGTPLTIRNLAMLSVGGAPHDTLRFKFIVKLQGGDDDF